MPSTRIAIAVLFAIGLLAIPAARVAACSCAMSTPEQAAAASDAVFTGSVVGTAQPPGLPDGDLLPGTGDTVYTFAVDAVAKGALGPEVSVLAGGDSGSCGMAFAADVRYLVFATADGGQLTTHLCSGSTELPVGDVAPLPMHAPRAADTTWELPLVPLAIGLAVLLVTATSVVAFRRPR